MTDLVGSEAMWEAGEKKSMDQFFSRILFTVKQCERLRRRRTWKG
jgi:hypothetical protein